MAGCASPGDTQPTPSGTPPSSPSPSAPFEENVTDEAAFAAAEATYRGYVDALNDVNLADPSSFESVYAWLDGQALEDARTSFTKMHAEGKAVYGESELAAFFLPRYKPTMIAVACLDVSGVELRDRSGKNVTSASRPDVYAMRLEFSAMAGSPTGLAVSLGHAIRDARCS